MSEHATAIQTSSQTSHADDPFAEVREMVKACMQCGTCSASCPSAFAMDMTPRAMWRSVILGLVDEVLNSKTFWLCSSCYTCTLRCPRGLPLTEAIAALRRIASRVGGDAHEKQASFYRVFMENIRENGRIHEMSLMNNYLLASRNPLLPLNFLPLGVKLFRKGKLSLWEAGRMEKHKLVRLFEKADEQEDRS